jgi:hypothetical protein
LASRFLTVQGKNRLERKGAKTQRRKANPLCFSLRLGDVVSLR